MTDQQALERTQARRHLRRARELILAAHDHLERTDCRQARTQAMHAWALLSTAGSDLDDLGPAVPAPDCGEH